jgi:uncharacterized surface protein with fasciclin (FAS1) repeats
MLKTLCTAGAVSALALCPVATAAQNTPTAPSPEQAMPEPEPEPEPAPAPAPAPEPSPSDAEAPVADGTPAEGTIAAAVAANAELSTLGSALAAADLAATLAGPGPFTVFAPTNAAFDLIPADTRTALMNPANKASLTTLLQFHVIAGNISADQLKQQIAAGNGTAELQTVAGQTLKASIEGDSIVLTGENNSKAFVTLADQNSSNGTVHVVNGILVPRLG